LKKPSPLNAVFRITSRKRERRKTQERHFSEFASADASGSQKETRRSDTGRVAAPQI